MSYGRQIGKNIASLLAGGVLGKLLRFLATVRVANVLGAQGFGALGVAIGVAALGALAADCGLSQLGTRELSQRTEGKRGLALNLLVLKLTVLAVVCAVGLAVIMLTPLKEEVRSLALVALLLVAANEAAFDWVFEGLGRVELMGLYRVLLNALFLGAVWHLVAAPRDIVLVPLVDAACSAAALAVCLVLWPKVWGQFAGPIDLSVWRRLLGGGMPFAAANLLVMAVPYVGIFMLVPLAGAGEAGIFRAAVAISFGLLSVGFLVSRAAYPVLSRVARERPEVTDETLAPVFRFILAGSIPAAVGLALVAPQVIGLLYEVEYARSATVLAAVAASIPMALVTTTCHYALLAHGRPGLRVAGLALQVVAEVALCAALTPRMAAVGAAAAHVAAQGASLVFTVASVWRLVRVRLLRHAIAPLAASIPMAAMLLWADAELAWTVPSACALYGASLYAVLRVRAAMLAGR